MPVIRDGVPYLTDTEFETQFKPHMSPGNPDRPMEGEVISQYNLEDLEDLAYDVSPNRVWTMVQCYDTGNLYITPGRHVVNREHFVITEKPWNDKTLDVLWWDEDAFDQECLEHERINNAV